MRQRQNAENISKEYSGEVCWKKYVFKLKYRTHRSGTMLSLTKWCNFLGVGKKIIESMWELDKLRTEKMNLLPFFCTFYSFIEKSLSTLKLGLVVNNVYWFLFDQIVKLHLPVIKSFRIFLVNLGLVFTDTGKQQKPYIPLSAAIPQRVPFTLFRGWVFGCVQPSPCVRCILKSL